MTFQRTPGVKGLTIIHLSISEKNLTSGIVRRRFDFFSRILSTILSSNLLNSLESFSELHHYSFIIILFGVRWKEGFPVLTFYSIFDNACQSIHQISFADAQVGTTKTSKMESFATAKIFILNNCGGLAQVCLSYSSKEHKSPVFYSIFNIQLKFSC